MFVVGRRKFAPGERGLPHNVAFVALGTGLLWFGWFGFNSGDGYAANGFAAQAFVNTDIAGSIAMCTWLAITWWQRRQAQPGRRAHRRRGRPRHASRRAPATCPPGRRSSSGCGAGSLCYCAVHLHAAG